MTHMEGKALGLGSNMQPGARLKAAAEVLDDVLLRHRPPSLALNDWGKGHRFAGSGDRAAIGTLVFDTLRVKASASFVMGAETSRAQILGMLAETGVEAEDILALCTGAPHALDPLTGREFARLEARDLTIAPPDVIANVPAWLWADIESVFGKTTLAEMQAATRRAPIDLRVNPLKSTREKVLETLKATGAEPSAFSPYGVRIPAPTGGSRAPNVEAEPAHAKGWFEVQDEGSQIAAALTVAGPRQQILDFCAGAGGKSLAMAGVMQNTGQIYAYDSDKVRLRPIFDRLKRAGARNVQVLGPNDRAALDELGPRFDCVLVDAPCSGSGTWRRKPDAKWRLKPDSLAARINEQADILARASAFVKVGGHLVYVTCSVLPQENSAQIDRFRAAQPAFTVVPWRTVWGRTSLGEAPKQSADGRDDTLLLSPHSHGTDGFFIAVLERKA